MSEERFDRIDDRFNQVEERFNRVETQVSELHQDMTAMKQDMTAMKQNVDALREDMTSLSQRVNSFEGTILTAVREGFQSLRNYLDDLNYEVADNSRATRLLKRRVTRLERKDED
jgi:chromosome segregation ATPase